MAFFRAVKYFFLMIFNGDFMFLVDSAYRGKLCEPSRLFSILQRDGRFVDFVMEDIDAFPDAQVGAVARTVHDGCRRALSDYMRFEPVMEQPEGSQVTVEAGFDPAAVRLSGEVKGQPPFRGNLSHHGWRIASVRLPAASGRDTEIVSPAEVEIGTPRKS